ncbi:MAG: two-component system OmpR family response regulator [Gammaproteobacteria bacterium]|jgi:two-component system OmpR family response regulator
MNRILLIDDDEKLAAPLAEYFVRFDMSLDAATHPQLGLQKLSDADYDLVILDVMLPDVDGFEVCRRIRKTSDIPIVMLTARGEVMDRVVGLELGADDYLPKPFEPRELVARIQNVLRRSNASKTAAVQVFGELSIDTATRTVRVQDREVDLTTMEYQLLVLLADSPGKNYTRDEILNELKGIDTQLLTRSVDILVSRLRQKLKPNEAIKTVWGSGYAFVAKS